MVAREGWSSEVADDGRLMGTTISVAFPLGRYHATPWDGGANTSDVEWPPSPWRLLRALVATWYARWPDLPAADLDRVLVALGAPDAYRTPAARPGSTRHYMPDVSHNTRETGNTDQVIDSFLAIPPRCPLLVHWAADLTKEDRTTLGKLVELLPYLGRSESICVAELLDEDATPDTSWWRLGEAGPDVRLAELLAPDGPVDRTALEASTVATRKARRLLPSGSRKISYGVHADESPAQENLPTKKCNAFRFELASPVPVRARNAVLVADAMHSAIAHTLGRSDDPAVVALLGRDSIGASRRDSHAHMHVFALPREDRMRPRIPAAEQLFAVVIWVPEDVDDALVGRIQDTVRQLWVSQHLEGQMARQDLLAADTGSITDVAPTLAASAAEWISLMPYLPVRHRKRRQSAEDHIAEDLRTECRYRGFAEPIDVSILVDPADRREIVQFRRRRGAERMDRQRSGVYVSMRFADLVCGPLALGQLSHFGFGSFVPSSGSNR